MDNNVYPYLSRLTNYEKRPSTMGALSLEPIRRLLESLGNPHDNLFIVHVAGTKGKGSFCAMLAQVMSVAGYRVGLYTSPEIERLEERIQVDGASIPAEVFEQLLAQVERDVQLAKSTGPSIGPTFFDVMTAIGFLYFSLQKVDIAIVEVGMGGRTDSTNVCNARLSVITSISFDHTKQLGDTLAAIASEKAGIIKYASQSISGVVDTEPRNVIRSTCARQRATLFELDVDFSYKYSAHAFSQVESLCPSIQVTTSDRIWPPMHLSLLGEHQAANASLVVRSVELLQLHGFVITDYDVAAGLDHTVWPARIEIVGRSPLAILDCAHNTASANALVETLRTSFPEFFRDDRQSARKRILVFAASRDKDIFGILSVLGPHFDLIILTQYTKNPRCAPLAALSVAAAAISKVAVINISDPILAWSTAISEAGTHGLVCSTGSLFLAGEIRASLR